jgi:hypothetical protein
VTSAPRVSHYIRLLCEPLSSLSSAIFSVGDIRIVSAGVLAKLSFLSALLQNDSFIYISRHERMKQGEKDERGTSSVGHGR